MEVGPAIPPYLTTRPRNKAGSYSESIHNQIAVAVPTSTRATASSTSLRALVTPTPAKVSTTSKATSSTHISTTAANPRPATSTTSTVHVQLLTAVTRTTSTAPMAPSRSPGTAPSTVRSAGTNGVTSTPSPPGSSSNRSTPVFVPILAAVFSVLGVIIFAVLIFFLCKRRRRKQAVMEHHELQKKARWASRWRLRGQGADGDGAKISRRATILSFITRAPARSPRIAAHPSAPVSSGSPPARAPFRFTTYRLSFSLKLPARFRSPPKKKAVKSARIASLQREFVLPAQPRPSYDRRSPPSVGSRTAQTIPTIYSKPSVRSKRTETTPPGYIPPSKDALVRNLGSLRDNIPPLPAFRSSSDVSNDTPASTPGPYQPIPSAVPTPLSQILVIPNLNLPLPRLMIVVSTFTPALSDELQIKVGQTLRLLDEYDDGWCLVERVEGYADQGAVPRFCLDELPAPTTPQVAGARSAGVPVASSSGPLPSPSRTYSLRRRRESRFKKGNYI